MKKLLISFFTFFFSIFIVPAIGQEELGLNQSTQAWVKNCSAMPSVRTFTAINLFIDAEINDLNFRLFDRLWILGVDAPTSAAVSLVNPTSTKITAVNSPTFTAYAGYQGNGTTSYLNTEYNPNTQGVNYTLDNACVGICLVSAPSSLSNAEEIGSYNGTNSTGVIIDQGGNDILLVNGTTNTATTAKGVAGLYVNIRTSIVATTGYYNGVSYYSSTVDSAKGIPNLVWYICGRNESGSLNVPTTRAYSMAFAGSSAINQVTLTTDAKYLRNLLGGW
jgi:hypothetical protein